MQSRAVEILIASCISAISAASRDVARLDRLALVGVGERALRELDATGPRCASLGRLDLCAEGGVVGWGPLPGGWC